MVVVVVVVCHAPHRLQGRQRGLPCPTPHPAPTPPRRARTHARRPCVEHAAPACTALLLLNSGAQQAPPPPPGPGGHPAQGAALAEADALAVVRAAATGLAPHLQELAQAARAAGLRLLLVVTQVCASAHNRAAL